MIEVARRYRFTATHHLPDAPAPWNEPHSHNYTVEVVAAGDETDYRGFVVDTDELDVVWESLRERFAGRDLNESLPVVTSVEDIAAHILNHYWTTIVSRVTVWEDDDRWGMAAR